MYLTSGPIGLVNLMTAKACGASKVCVTGRYTNEIKYLLEFNLHPSLYILNALLDIQ